MKSDCIYYFPIDLELNGIPFGFKSMGKWCIQSDFGLYNNNQKSISLKEA